MIEVTRLTKSYRDKLAVDDVSFSVARGEVVGFLGPNGAGKTTTMRIVAGFLGRTSGTVRVMGHDIDEEPLEARAAIGYMPEGVPLYPEMRVAEYLTFRAELKGVPGRRRRSRVADALARAGVMDYANRTIGHLSKGYRQRVGLADALVSDPPVLILDEPTAGLDPNQIRETRVLITELGRDHAVLVSTHLLGEAEATCDRILVISSGKVVAVGPKRDVLGMAGVRVLDLVVRGDRARALAVVKETIGAEPSAGDLGAHSRREPDVHEFSFPLAKGAMPGISGGAACERVVSALGSAGLLVREIKMRAGTLEQVFADLTRAPDSPSSEAANPR